MADLGRAAYALANQASKTVKNGYNLDEGLRSFRNALSDVDRNPLKIACIGDSVTYGYYAGDLINSTWVGRLRTIMQSKLGNVGQGFKTLPNELALDNPQWTKTGTWTHTNAVGIGGHYYQSSTAGSTLTVTFTGTSFDLIIAKGNGGSTDTTVKIDNVAQANPNFTGGGIWSQVVSYSGLTAGSHTFLLTVGTGTVWVEGLVAYNPISGTPKGCYVHCLGQNGARAGWFTTSPANMMSAINPHLVIIALGINDAINNSQTYYSDMSTLIQAYQAGGASVLLLPYYIGNDSATVISNYLTVVQQQYQLADQFNCGLIDIYTRWGKSFNLAQTAGLMGNSAALNGNSGSDAWHPSDKGMRDIANAIAYHLIGQVS